MSVRIQLRRGTASQWTTANPTLAEGELGLETDTGQFKFGDGLTDWAGLAYGGGSGGAVTSVNGRTGIVTGLAEQSSLTAEATLARNGDNITGGTVADARIASTIARDSEVTAAISALSSVYQAKDTTLDTYAGIDPSSNVQSILGAANYSAIRTLLSLVAGTDFYSTSATDAAIAAAVAGLYDIKGTTNCSTNPNYPAASKGDVYYVSVAGKIGGASGTVVEAGDSYVAIADNAGGTQASVGSSWVVTQGNVNFSSNGLSLVTAANYAAMVALLQVLPLTGGTLSGTVGGTGSNGSWSITEEGVATFTGTDDAVTILNGLLTAANLAVAVGGGLTINDTVITRPATGRIQVDGVEVQLAGKSMIPVMAGGMSPSATGGCAALATIASAANQPDIQTLDFDASTEEYAQFSIPMPESWNEGTVTFAPIWSHGATTTNFGVVFELQAVAVSNDDTIKANYGTAVTSTDTGGTTDDVYVGPESAAITIAGTPATGDTVFFRIGRKTADSNDNMAVDARLHGIRLYYTSASGADS